MMFRFLTFDNLEDDEIRLVARSHDEQEMEKENDAPRYRFSIVHIKDDIDIGVIYFAVDSSRRQYLRGHLSYGVSPAYAGHSYAAKACRLVKRVALAHGFDRLFIGAKDDNIASIRTIEKLGALPITAGDVPDHCVLRELQAEKIRMYIWWIAEQSAIID